MVSSVAGDPDDTELPRLTSDFRLRRSAGGEILISSSGPERCVLAGINPPEWSGQATTGRGGPGRVSVVFIPSGV